MDYFIIENLAIPGLKSKTHSIVLSLSLNCFLFDKQKKFIKLEPECRYSDSNRDALALLPKSSVSTSFTIAAAYASL